MSEENRIIELEKKIAFQEHTLSELNSVVIEQQKRIDLLEKEIRALRFHIEDEGIIKNPNEEKPPPHY